MDESDGASISPLTTWSFPSSIHDLAFVSSQEELRALLFATAQTPISTKRNSYVAPTNDEGDECGTSGTVDSHRTTLQIRQILATDRRLEYLKSYINRVAPWLDMFDSRRAFGIQIPAFIRESPALLYAVLAVSARQLELQGGIRNTLDSLELYQEAIRLLKPLLQQRDQDAIVVCVILCCMEMMSASGEDWRRHLDGCAALFGSFNVNGFSGGLLRALFWCYARMDLCGALMSDGTQCTLIEPNKWLPAGTREEEVRDLFGQSHSSDMHANYAVYLCAKVTELIADRTNYVELGEENGCTHEEYAERWLKLWDSLRTWLNDRPEELLPVHAIPSEPFPQILFVHWAAISSNQLHHTACLLLLGMTPKKIKLEAGEANSAQSYAKRICGISLTNPHEGCLNNAIQPLWIAGRYLSHRTEHALLVKLFRTIEQSTGWVTSWRVADLEHTWGYKIRTS